MAKITFDGLTGAVNTELQTYSSEVIKIVNDAGDAAVKKLVDITKKSAPKLVPILSKILQLLLEKVY